MDKQSPNDTFDGSSDAEVNMSQSSSGIDMHCEDMSSQENNQDSRVNQSTGIKPTQVLQRALDKLKENFTDFNVPTNESDWQQLYESTLFKSKKHVITYEEHLWTWLQLITTAKHLKITEQTVLNCYSNAISMLPIKLFEPDTTWVALINALYSQIIAGEISESDASGVLETAENKFKFSPKHARIYWNAVLKNEKQLMKNTKKPLLEQQRKIVQLLTTRFSNPYLNMEEDYHEFARWSLDVDLDKELRVQVQQAFLEHSKLRKMAFVTNILDKHLERTNELKHHLFFEEWIDAICTEESPSYDSVEIICEEIIAAEPDSICYYWLFLNALSSPKFEGITKREDKIYDVILRGYRCGKTHCEGMDQQFLEQSIVIASKIIGVGKVLELVEAAMTNTHFTITNNTTKWYAISRGVIVTITNLIREGHLDAGSFDRYFSRIIAPCTMDLFKVSEVPPELAEKTGYETQYLELLKLWVTCQESYYPLTWEKILQLWTNTFMYNENPIMLVGYVDFVKGRGTSSEALEATSFALVQMSSIEKSEVPSKSTTRRCYIKLLKDHLDVLQIIGDVGGQIATAKELQRKLNHYISLYTNEFRDLTTPGLTINGFCPYESMWNSDESEKLSQESVITCDTNSSDNSIVTQLNSLVVDPESNNREEKDLLKVFVANLNFCATEEDLSSAFKDKGLNPLKIDMMKFHNGKPRGMAHVTFETKEEADVAIQECDRFNVCGRTTFVSPFRRRPKLLPVDKPVEVHPLTKPVVAQTSTLINITNLPAAWKDEEKISKKLSCYGHVKRVATEEHDDSSFTIRVEFHMTEDARNAYKQVVEKKIFGELVMCRMGYVSNKRQMEAKNSDKEMNVRKKMPKKSSKQRHMESDMEVAHGSNSETSSLKLTDAAEKAQQIGPEMPPGLAKEKPKPTKRFNFVPMQAFRQDMPRVTKRSHMKAKLDYGGSSSSSESPMKKVVRMSEEEMVSLPHSTTNDETELDVASSQSSDDSLSPQKKTIRMSTDKDVKQLLITDNEKNNSANGDETSSRELECATNSDMEEDEINYSAKPSLTNKDFQKLFKKR